MQVNGLTKQYTDQSKFIFRSCCAIASHKTAQQVVSIEKWTNKMHIVTSFCWYEMIVAILYVS